MSIVLKKRGTIQLEKDTRYGRIGLGWHVNEIEGKPEHDFDVSVLLLGSNNKCNRDEDFIFYGNLVGRNNCVIHTGDDKTGSSDDVSGYDHGTDGNYVNDCEVVKIDFDSIPNDVTKILVICTIYEAEKRRQTFKDAKNSYIRLVKVDSPESEFGTEKVRFNMSDELGFENGVIVAEINRTGHTWEFKAIGEGFNGGLEYLLPQYGLAVE